MKRRKKFPKIKRPQIKKQQVIAQFPYMTFAIVAGIIVTIASSLFESLAIFGTHIRGVSYHGWPIAWCGHLYGPGSYLTALMHIGHPTYLTGFIIDLIFWIIIGIIGFCMGKYTYNQCENICKHEDAITFQRIKNQGWDLKDACICYHEDHIRGFILNDKY